MSSGISSRRSPEYGILSGASARSAFQQTFVGPRGFVRVELPVLDHMPGMQPRIQAIEVRPKAPIERIDAIGHLVDLDGDQLGRRDLAVTEIADLWNFRLRAYGGRVERQVRIERSISEVIARLKGAGSSSAHRSANSDQLRTPIGPLWRTRLVPVPVCRTPITSRPKRPEGRLRDGPAEPRRIPPRRPRRRRFRIRSVPKFPCYDPHDTDTIMLTKRTTAAERKRRKAIRIRS